MAKTKLSKGQNISELSTTDKQQYFKNLHYIPINNRASIEIEKLQYFKFKQILAFVKRTISKGKSETIF